MIPAPVLALGCGLLAPDAERLAALERALDEAEPVPAVGVFLRGAVDAGAVRFDCATAIGAAATDEPALRAVALHYALEDWRAFCPGACTSAEGAPGGDPPAIGPVLSRCDADGPDPVFGGPLAPLRPSMPVHEYLAVRMLAERALPVAPGLEAQLPKLAAGIVLAAPRPEVAPTADLRVVSDRPVPADAFDALGAAVLACGSGATVAHRLVVDGAGRVLGAAGPPEGVAPDCVTEALHRLALPAAPDGAYAVVDLTWRPEPPAPAPAQAPSRRPTVTGPLGRDVIQAVITESAGKLRYCYEKQLSRDPDLAGRVTVAFTIGADGAVPVARITSDTLGAPEVARCLADAFRGLVFPAPGQPVTVSWPVTFAR